MPLGKHQWPLFWWFHTIRGYGVPSWFAAVVCVSSVNCSASRATPAFAYITYARVKALLIPCEWTSTAQWCWRAHPFGIVCIWSKASWLVTCLGHLCTPASKFASDEPHRTCLARAANSSIVPQITQLLSLRSGCLLDRILYNHWHQQYQNNQTGHCPYHWNLNANSRPDGAVTCGNWYY